jgi:hypothetical protein
VATVVTLTLVFEMNASGLMSEKPRHKQAVDGFKHAGYPELKVWTRA